MKRQNLNGKVSPSKSTGRGCLVWLGRITVSIIGLSLLGYIVEPMAEAADAARRALADLQQTVSSLESAQQQVADQISELQRQLLNQQGERKLLSEQVGALSARVDSLMDSTAATPVPTGPPAQKRRGPR